jgi:hypothetical protein
MPRLDGALGAGRSRVRGTPGPSPAACDPTGLRHTSPRCGARVRASAQLGVRASHHYRAEPVAPGRLASQADSQSGVLSTWCAGAGPQLLRAVRVVEQSRGESSSGVSGRVLLERVATSLAAASFDPGSRSRCDLGTGRCAARTWREPGARRAVNVMHTSRSLYRASRSDLTFQSQSCRGQTYDVRAAARARAAVRAGAGYRLR